MTKNEKNNVEKTNDNKYLERNNFKFGEGASEIKITDDKNN